MGAGSWKEAASALEKAVALAPKSARMWANLCRALTWSGERVRAIEAGRTAIRLDPNLAQAYNSLGIALDAQGLLEEAADAFRHNVRLAPHIFLGHANLGHVLYRMNRFAEALAEFKRAEELLGKEGAARHPYPQEYAQVKRWLELEPRLFHVLQGEKARPEELVQLAELCRKKQQWAQGAQLYRQAFTAEPALAETGLWNRLNAALAANQAADGTGTDGGFLSAEERSRWRQQALEWIQADLAFRTKRWEASSPQERGRIRQMLQSLMTTADLASVREPAALEKLPGEEREKWRKVWEEVRTLLQRKE
jgi:tetratricopeptide (TPR) repeat protein